MKIKLIMMGKTQEKFVEEGFKMYTNRLTNYLPFEAIEIPGLKKAGNFSPAQIKESEGILLAKHIAEGSYTVLLDEKGKSFDSVGFSEFVQQRMNSGVKLLNFVIGGAYGFSDDICKLANQKITLSSMTFSHQIVRIIFMEQLYRAMTILKNEPYHNA
ncbi:MAG: 23S rRNA (pseudouridine(1915)-N(3))-methyltransferase RlmH [Bacteroidales bacterium]